MAFPPSHMQWAGPRGQSIGGGAALPRKPLPILWEQAVSSPHCHPCPNSHLQFFFNLFYIGIEPITNAVIISGGQQRDSAIRIHVSIVPQTPFSSRLPHNIEQSSLCLYSKIFLVIHFKLSSVYMSIPNSLTIPLLHSPPTTQQP